MGDLKPPQGQVFGDVCIRKQRRKRQKLLLIEILNDYAKNSTLHGLRYIVERGLLLIEKLFWFLTFLMSFGMCFYLMTNVWIKWKKSPVIVSFSERVVPVGDVPFPSITICPQLKSKASVYNFSKEYEIFMNYTGDGGDPSMNISMWEKLDNIDMLCGKDMTEVYLKRGFANHTIIQDFYDVAPDVNDVFFQCEWRSNNIDCAEVFKAVVTNEGICFNFNALAESEILRLEEGNLQKDYRYITTEKKSADWSIEKGYSDYRPDHTYPRRGGENNALPDLRVILKEDPEDRDGLCNVLRGGYRIYVQHPANLPQASLYYYAALSGQVSSLALKFSMITSDDLTQYTSKVRQCYYPNDKKLLYFKIYTASNCRLECQSLYTFKKCGCVWFHMPHSDSQHICTSSTDLSCYIEAREELTQADLKQKPVGEAQPCNCLPSCDSVNYDAEILKTEFNIKAYLQTYEKIHKENFTDLTSKNMSQIEVYFKEPHFVSMRRSELFGITDFLANCGGLLGLFLGFSFLSLVEIFYFITFRVCYILRRDLKEEKLARKESEIKKPE